MTEAEKAYQYFVIAVPENEEQAKAYFWARKALQPTLTQQNEWVSVEQLREMDGQPVWIVRLEDNLGWWAIVRLGNDRANTDYGAYFMLSDYGKTWLAYAYPPAHIDREAWEPCRETCRNTCMSCDHNADELFGDADYCEDCHHYSKWESSVHKYCELCGRPKTPEAWAELEKRVRG